MANATSIGKLIKNTLDKHAEEITAATEKVLIALATYRGQIDILSDREFRYNEDEVIDSLGNIKPATLRKRIQNVNHYFKSQDNALSLKQNQGIVLMINPALLYELKTEEMLKLSRERTDLGNPSHLIQPEYYSDPAVFISHKWHPEEPVNAIFREFAQALAAKLDSGVKGRKKIRLLYDCAPAGGGFNHHEPRQPQQDAFCERAQLALICWSDHYLNSTACAEELAYFIHQNGDNIEHKKAIVILERGRFDEMPERLTKRNEHFYPLGSTQSLLAIWEGPNQSEKDNYIAELADKIYFALEQSPTEIRSEKPLDKQKTLEKQLNLSSKLSSGELFDGKPKNQPTHFKAGERRELIPDLANWALNQTAQSTRVAVLLGDFGFGKTTSCQMLADVLRKDFEANKPGALLPIYLDLKTLLTDIANNKNKPIEHLIETLLTQTGSTLSINGEEVINYARQHPTLVIFDGFDEIGHHLNETEQQAVYRSLLNIFPDTVYRQDAARLAQQAGDTLAPCPSKLLISCRTHFFERVSKQQSFIRGSDRHPLGDRNTGNTNISEFIVAPFSQQSVEDYLTALLGDDEGHKAIAMLDAIHDLSSLSSHPLMLGLISQQLPALFELKQQGKTVNAATLYALLFQQVGDRDTEKHIIRLNDKQELLAALALHLWQNQTTTISIKKLDRWFLNFCTQHPGLKLQASQSLNAFQALLRDLCNACLLVRNDKDEYRFAHTSYLEFFTAIGLFEGIRTCGGEDFNFLTNGKNADLNNETLGFLTSWRESVEIDEKEEFDKQFIRLLECKNSDKYCRRAGFDIWRFGQLKSLDSEIHFPHSTEANWSDLIFEEAFIPQSLQHLDFSQLNLSGCRFDKVMFCRLNLMEANLSDCNFGEVYFHFCDIENVHWGNRLQNFDCCYPNTTRELSYEIKPFFEEHYDSLIIGLSHDSSQIISIGLDGNLKLWDTSSGKHSLTKADGQWIGENEGDEIIVLRDTSTNGRLVNIERKHFKQKGDIVNSNNDFCLKNSIQTFTLKDLKGGFPLNTLTNHTDWATSATYNPKGDRIISTSYDNSLKLWHAYSGKCLATLEGHEGWVASAVFNHDGSRIVSASSDNSLKLWDADTCECLITFSGHKHWVKSVAFSPDSLRVVSASYDNTLKIWDAETGNLLLTLQGHSHWVTCALFSHDGKRIISASADKTIRLWDAYTGQCLQTLEGHTEAVNSVALNPDGSMLASGSDDHRILLWDLPKSECLQTLEDHNHCVTSVAFEPDGERLLSASDDNTLKLWSLASGECLQTLEGHNGEVTSGSFSQDGRRIVSASHDNSVRIWTAKPGECIRTTIPLKNGEIIYTEQGGETIFTHLSGDAWQYVKAQKPDGSLTHPCQSEDWGEIYQA